MSHEKDVYGTRSCTVVIPSQPACVQRVSRNGTLIGVAVARSYLIDTSASWKDRERVGVDIQERGQPVSLSPLLERNPDHHFSLWPDCADEPGGPRPDRPV